MKASRRKPLLPVIAMTAAVMMMAGCPLPYEYNGKGASNEHTSDPSSPDMTAPVTVSYSVQGGASGTVGDGGAFYAGQTTTVTLSTATVNAVIFYTDNGTPLTLTGLESAKRISASSGQMTITRTTSLQSLDIHAIAIGPNMLPGTPVHAIVGVSPYPILSVTSDKASMSEDGGTATFTITSSSAPTADITVSLQTSGTYVPADLTGPLPASGQTFTAVLKQSTTTVSLPITGVHDTDNVNQTVTVTILPDPALPTTYTAGAPASATVVIQDDNTPVLNVTASPSSVPDNGGVAVFTVTSSFAPTSDLTVHLQTGGAYKPTDVTGLPGSGSSLAVTLPAGATVLSLTVTAHPDFGEFLNQTVTVSLVADPTYTIGTSGSATATLIDTSPIPVLTLSAFPATVTDGQISVFTVLASVAPDADHTVSISSSGYTPGTVSVPSSVTIPAGATSASFQVFGPSQIGYGEQTPLVSLVPGIGHTIGSPGAQGLVIYDDVMGPFVYDGAWGFNTGTASDVGTGNSWTLTGNVTLGSGGLTFGGVYGTDDARVNIPNFDKNLFTLAVKFTLADLSVVRPIIVGGFGYRWIMAQADSTGSLSVVLNNHSISLPLGMTIAVGTTYTLVLNVDVAALTITAWLNGVSVIVPLPAGFTWNNPTGDEQLLGTDWSTNLHTFMGTWDWVFAVNGLLSDAEVNQIVTSRGL